MKDFNELALSFKSAKTIDRTIKLDYSSILQPSITKINKNKA